VGNEDQVHVVDVELERFQKIQKDMGERWLAGTDEILKSRNPELRAELIKTEGIIDSLLALGPKPKILQKQLDDTLAHYERLVADCITYASRHLPKPTASAVMN
jgi:hypothetical protein